jgi:hypothetical protein
MNVWNRAIKIILEPTVGGEFIHKASQYSQFTNISDSPRVGVVSPKPVFPLIVVLNRTITHLLFRVVPYQVESNLLRRFRFFYHIVKPTRSPTRAHIDVTADSTISMVCDIDGPISLFERRESS